MTQAIRLKLAQAKPSVGGAERAWRHALARACDGLDMEVAGSRLLRCSLAELLDLLPDQAMLALLEGPEEGQGLCALAPPVLDALIEGLTLGAVSPRVKEPRKPTRTDAMLTMPVIGGALKDLAEGLDADPDLRWTDAFRYGSFVEDARTLHLLLEDAPFHLLSVDLMFAGVKGGQILLALPTDGRGRMPELLPAPDDPADFPAGISAQVMEAEVVLRAVIGRVSLPLASVLRLETGELLALPDATLDTLTIEAADGRRIGEARLGQNRGMRALRLSDAQEPPLPTALRAVG